MIDDEPKPATALWIVHEPTMARLCIATRPSEDVPWRCSFDRADEKNWRWFFEAAGLDVRGTEFSICDENSVTYRRFVLHDSKQRFTP